MGLVNGDRMKSQFDMDMILDALPDGMVVIETGGTIQKANAKCRSMLDYETLAGMNIGELIAHNDLPRFQGEMKRIREAGAPHTGREFTMVTSCGREISCILNCTALRDECGESAGVLCVVREGEHLYAALEKIESLIKMATVRKDFSVRFDNSHLAKCYEVMKCAKEECPCHGKSDTRCWQVAGTFCGGEIQGQFAEKYESCATCPVFRNAVPDHHMRIGEQFNNMMHILESKNREFIEACRSAQQADRLKSEFLANISHEIRTPLNGIIGMITLAMETRLTEEQRDYMITAEKSAYALLDIVNDLIEISRIESGTMPPEPRIFNFHQAMQQIAQTLTRRASARNLEFLWHQDARAPSHVMGDQEMIQQILLKLGDNAIKFTDRGSISMRISACEDTEDCVTMRFSISDSGIGIPHDKHDMIFKKFVQIDGSHTRARGGTGLGLAISKELVDLMGGRMGFESIPGKGSTFWFILSLMKR
jgi:PAS domain S-box-containing protein